MIKEITNLNEALSLIEKSYLENIKDEDTINGQKTFINDFLYSNETINEYKNMQMKIFGYYINNNLAGVISINKKNYIKFLFVDKKYLNKGIGRKLLDYIVSITPPNTKITLDSSLSSKDFYIKYGFIQKSDVLQMNEMKYIEMEYQI